MFQVQALISFFSFRVWIIGAGCFFLTGWIGMWWTAVVGAVLLLANVIYLAVMPQLLWSGWTFWVRSDDLLVASGVLVREVVAIPLHRVQHVDVTQGPIERAFGLASLAIYTGTGLGVDGLIPGLDLARANRLRDMLVQAVADDGV
jgi:membrane protein YdbS with pleckstrin-like domain